jgi:hypothetical protein
MTAFGPTTLTKKRLAHVARAAGFAVAAFLMTPSPAQAFPFPPSPSDVHRRVEHDVRRLLEIPRAIHRAHVDAFRSFSGGRVYYGPHHHYHSVYNFPVSYGGRVSYRPYSYCNDSLFIGAGVPVPRIVVNVRPGPYPCYYYTPGPPPPPPVYYRDRGCDHSYDDRYDDRRYIDRRYDDRRHDDDHGRYDDRNDHGRYDDNRDRDDNHDRGDDDNDH